VPFRCPVCGYRELPEPPVNFSICPCCGTEFGYDDATKFHSTLRQEWVNAGVQWFSRSRLAPPDWNAWMQLIEANLSYVLPFRADFRLQQSAVSSGRMISEQNSTPMHV
jgi:hypothetical protein